MTTNYHGPFIEMYPYIISVDDFEVPFIKGRKNDDGSWTLILDDRFSIDVTEEEIQKWMWWTANAMAIAAGYSCFGENSRTINNFQRHLTALPLSEIENEE